MSPTELKVNDRWRFDPLSSSVPLEYQIAKQLVKSKFSVQADYVCERVTDDVGDWSVDIYAQKFAGHGIEFGIDVELLVECKYRRPGSITLFFEDPNDNFSPFETGSAIRIVDELSEFRLGPSPASLLDNLPKCFKGVEIKPESSKGKVDDTELRHGLQQLQWALPRLFATHVALATESIDNRLDDEIYATLLCPILVTTSQLRLASRRFSSQILLDNGIEAVSKAVDGVIVFLDTSPAFFAHWRKMFDAHKDAVRSDHLQRLAEFRKQYLKCESYESPVRFLRKITDGDVSTVDRLCTQFIVCTDSAFPEIVKAVVETSRVLFAKRKRFTKDQRARLTRGF